jgi:hypothetical protein
VGVAPCQRKILPPALDLRQHFIDHDVFLGGIAQGGVEAVQQVGDAFLFAAHQSHADLFANGRQGSTTDRRDFTDRELTVGRVEECLDVFEGFAGRMSSVAPASCTLIGVTTPFLVL